jgi:hypothetical protein
MLSFMTRTIQSEREITAQRSGSVDPRIYIVDDACVVLRLVYLYSRSLTYRAASRCHIHAFWGEELLITAVKGFCRA